MNLMSRPVISGFQSGAAVTIGVGQLKNMFGYKNFGNDSRLQIMIHQMIINREEASHPTRLREAGEEAGACRDGALQRFERARARAAMHAAIAPPSLRHPGVPSAGDSCQPT